MSKPKTGQLLIKGVRPQKQMSLNLRPNKVVGYIGDVNWLEHDGGPVYRDKNGDYTLEYVLQDPENSDVERRKTDKWQVFRISLDREVPNWINLGEISSFTGLPEDEIQSAFLSSNPMIRANAYIDAANYYGYQSFDDYPLTLTKSELNRRYFATVQALKTVGRGQQVRMAMREWE
jgi:hypothetical protein